MNHLQLTQADHGKNIQAKISDQVTIFLNENPTTGYRWAMDNPDPQFLELKSSDYLFSPNSGIGGGGIRKIMIELKKVGSIRLALKLWRDWEGDSSVIERFAVSFDILQ